MEDLSSIEWTHYFSAMSCCQNPVCISDPNGFSKFLSLLQVPNISNITITTTPAPSIGTNASSALRNPLPFIYGASTYSSHRIPTVSQLLIVLYATLSSLGLTFNIALVVAMLLSKALNNITNVFVLMLSFSDIVLCAFNIPMQTFYEINETTGLGTAMCRILFTSFGLPLYVSCLTILLIAIDRHQMIVYPLRRRMTTNIAVGLIVAVILFSVVNSIPVAIYTKGKSMGTAAGHQYCVEDWPTLGSRLAYSVAIFGVHFLCPLLISATLYLHIYLRLSKRVFKKKDAEHKKRTNKILMSVVACFAICWTPWCLYSLLLEVQAYVQSYRQSSNNTFITIGKVPIYCNYFGTLNSNSSSTDTSATIISGRHMKLIDLLLKLFAMSSACVNPFLYGWLNEPIRLAMRRLWRRIIGKAPDGIANQMIRLKPAANTATVAVNGSIKPLIKTAETALCDNPNDGLTTVCELDDDIDVNNTHEFVYTGSVKLKVELHNHTERDEQQEIDIDDSVQLLTQQPTKISKCMKCKEFSEKCNVCRSLAPSQNNKTNEHFHGITSPKLSNGRLFIVADTNNISRDGTSL